MAIIVYCKKCGRKNSAPDAGAGKRGKCAGCSEVMDIPTTSETGPPLVQLQAVPEVSAPIPSPPSQAHTSAVPTQSTAIDQPKNAVVGRTLTTQQTLAIGALAVTGFCAMASSLSGWFVVIGLASGVSTGVLLASSLQKVPEKARYGGGILAGVALYCLAGYTLGDIRWGGTSSSSPSSSTPSNSDDAIFVGTWEDKEPGTVWSRFVIRENGTFEMRTKLPADDDWGSPKPGKWTRSKGKFSDTGEPYDCLDLTFDERTMGPSRIVTLAKNITDTLTVKWGKSDRFIRKVSN